VCHSREGGNPDKSTLSLDARLRGMTTNVVFRIFRSLLIHQLRQPQRPSLKDLRGAHIVVGLLNFRLPNNSRRQSTRE
jgi:hypothetical protein